MYEIKKINYEDTKPFILNIHYAKRMPSISFAYGLFFNKELVGVVSYGHPPSQSLCKGIAGENNKHLVLELNRLVLKYNKKNEASMLVGKSIKLLPKPKIIISYADISQNHIGYIYQATNFIYTGLSAKRKEWQMIGKNKHSFTICEQYTLKERKNNPDKFYIINRPRKHRYLYFIGSKQEKRKLIQQLKYPIFNYPKSNEVNHG